MRAWVVGFLLCTLPVAFFVLGASAARDHDRQLEAAQAEQKAFDDALAANEDISALSTIDCGKLRVVVFIKRDGSQEIIIVQSEDQIPDIVARANQLPARSVSSLINDRPCK